MILVRLDRTFRSGSEGITRRFAPSFCTAFSVSVHRYVKAERSFPLVFACALGTFAVSSGRHGLSSQISRPFHPVEVSPVVVLELSD
jgi:hypothetical protein